MAVTQTTSGQKLEYVYPKLELPWIKAMVENYNQMHDIELPPVSKATSIGELDEKIQKVLYEVFVSHTLTSQFALKYRFLNFMKYAQVWNKFEIVEEDGLFGELHVNLVLRDPKDKALTWVFFQEIMNEKVLRDFRKTCAGVRGAKETEVASKIAFICGKSSREITVDDPITLKIAGIQNRSWSIPFEIWIEDKNTERPFNDDDLLVIRDAEFAGFNFSSINDLLDVVKSTFGDGQYEITRVPSFFGQSYSNKSQEKEVIWKGIIFPKKIFK